MNWLDAALLFVAGIVGGLAGSIAGLASVSTYPALLLVGLPPVAANVTNTVALVFNGIGSISGSLPELRGQRTALTRLIPVAVVGGAAGATLLLSIPSEGFENVVPVLLAASAV
ncbi:MAG: TSUP family transporter, partial [Mycobacterium sp.]